jgi:peptidoglycan hydrolase-like protein with peptidoglycan-binding domain
MTQTKADITVTTPDPGSPTFPTRRRRWPIVLLVLVVAGAAGVAFIASSGGDDASTATVAANRTFREVVTTDLVAVETLDGVVGFDAGDPILAGAAGRLTAAIEPGIIATEGDILFEIDAEPIPLLFSDEIFYRPLGLTIETEPVTIRAQGVFTEVPSEGDVIAEGDVLARVDGQPIVVLDGEVPAYRRLVPPIGRAAGTDGPDVLQFEEALARLGYDPDGSLTIDEEFTSYTSGLVEDFEEAYGATVDGQIGVGDILWTTGPLEVHEVLVDVGDRANDGVAVFTVVTDVTGPEGDDVLALEQALTRLGFDPGAVDGFFDDETEAAVIAWQRTIGAEDDGVVDPADVVLLAGPVRIADRLVDPGASVSPNTSVLSTSTDEPVVAIDLPAEDTELLEVGDRVTVELPNRDEVAGRVTFKATTVTQQPQNQGGATLDVLVALDDPSAGLAFDQAGVEVAVVTEQRRGVMAVPVTALLALAEGGYAVEVDAGDGTTYLVAVAPGLYADGLVEVDSDALLPGQMVIAP